MTIFRTLPPIHMALLAIALGGPIFKALPSQAAPRPSDQVLLAQQVIDGLPPPPSIPELQGQPLPPASAAPSAVTPVRDQLYMVYVNGDSPLLLEQVRRVEPTAIVQAYEGEQVILAGLFEQATDAELQASALAAQGIESEIVPVSSAVLEPSTSSNGFADLPALPPANLPATASSREVEFRSPAATAPASVAANSPDVPSGQDSSFYIVIPGAADSLPQMREQVLLLGARQESVEARDRPLGPHLLVGPFVDRSSATRWNRFFRDFGMDARIYYRR